MSSPSSASNSARVIVPLSVLGSSAFCMGRPAVMTLIRPPTAASRACQTFLSTPRAGLDEQAGPRWSGSPFGSFRVGNPPHSSLRGRSGLRQAECLTHLRTGHVGIVNRRSDVELAGTRQRSNQHRIKASVANQASNSIRRARIIRRQRPYFEQLLGEALITTYSKGQPIREWRPKKGIRHEALDARVYAYAAVRALVSMGLVMDAEVDRIVAQGGPQPAQQPTVSRLSHSRWMQS